MRLRLWVAVSTAIASGVLVAVTAIWWCFERDLDRARARAAEGSVVLATPCGPIEYQEAGAGMPLLAIHGSGGGHDQGMAFAGSLASQGVRVISMSGFGYLRTPMPADASAAAQADAHVCLLDALGVRQAGVLGGSAGAPSALAMAIRHPDRVSALVLLVPVTYKPPTLAESAPPLPPWVESTMMRLIGSDFLYWAALDVARDQVIKVVLATPPGLLSADRFRTLGLHRREVPVRFQQERWRYPAAEISALFGEASGSGTDDLPPRNDHGRKHCPRKERFTVDADFIRRHPLTASCV